MTTPLETEQQARQLPAVRAVYEAFDADPGVGKMAPHNYLMLVSACEAAGVDLGSPSSYDRQILAWLAGWTPEIAAVVAGIITRAAAGPGLAAEQFRHLAVELHAEREDLRRQVARLEADAARHDKAGGAR